MNHDEAIRHFDEGARARKEGKPITACPYGIETEAEADRCSEWRRGWKGKVEQQDTPTGWFRSAPWGEVID